jgi:hypothetical protein
MPTHLRPRLLAWAVFGLALAACSDNPTGPSTGTPDLSALLAELSSPTISSATRAILPAGVGEMTIPAIDPGRCPYSASTGFFVCQDLVVNGITITRIFRLIDAAGNSQSKPDAQTAVLEMVNTVKGTMSAPAGFGSNGTVTLNDSSDMTLSGIRTEQHTLNGFSKDAMVGTFESNGVTLPLNSVITQTTNNVVLPNAKAGQKWPQSGSITIDDTSDIETGASSPVTTHVVMTFNGTSVVTITFTDTFGTTTCHFDMANPGVSAGACS